MKFPELLVGNCSIELDRRRTYTESIRYLYTYDTLCDLELPDWHWSANDLSSASKTKN